MNEKVMFSMKIQEQNVIHHMKNTYVSLTPSRNLIKYCTIIMALYLHYTILYYPENKAVGT
jgi:hypothetical protein